jgi:replicative DNA helicase
MTAATVTQLNKKFAPHIIEEELLSAIVFNKQKLTTFIDEILPEFFNVSDCKTIFKIIKMHFTKYSASPKKNTTISYINKILGDAEKRTSISSTIFDAIDRIYDRKEFSDDELSYIHDEILKFIKTNKIRDVIFEGIQKIDDPESFDEINEKLKNAVLWRIDENLGVDIREVKERYARQKEVMEAYMPTPWENLNSVIGGGFFAKTLNTFVAASSVGKSIALDQIAFHSWANLKKNVVLISLELSEEIKSMRIDTHFTKLFMSDLIKRQKDVENAYQSLDTGNARLIIKEFPTSSVSSRRIITFIEKLEMYSDFKPDIIVIDYGDILLPNSMKKNSMYEAGGEVSEQLRGIGYHFNVPIINATQFNRNVADKPPQEVSEYDISESHKKMMTNDNIIAIVATPAMRAQGQAAFKTLKARFGQKDYIVPMNVSYETFTFTEL